MMQGDHGDGGGIPRIIPSPTQSKCRLQALHGNEVYVNVLSCRNPSVRSKSFHAKEQNFINYNVYNLLRFNGV